MAKIEIGGDPIAAKLDMLIRLQATSLVGNMQSQREKLAFLDKAGLSSADIASIVGMTTANVSKTLYKIRQSNKSGRGTDEDA